MGQDAVYVALTAAHALGARAWDIFCTANFLNFLPWMACINFFLAAGTQRISSYDEALVGQLVRSIDEISKF